MQPSGEELSVSQQPFLHDYTESEREKIHILLSSVGGEVSTIEDRATLMEGSGYFKTMLSKFSERNSDTVRIELPFPIPRKSLCKIAAYLGRWEQVLHDMSAQDLYYLLHVAEFLCDEKISPLIARWSEDFTLGTVRVSNDSKEMVYSLLIREKLNLDIDWTEEMIIECLSTSRKILCDVDYVSFLSLISVVLNKKPEYTHLFSLDPFSLPSLHSYSRSQVSVAIEPKLANEGQAFLPMEIYYQKIKHIISLLGDDFPWTSSDETSGVAICGGAVVNLLCGIESGDIDLFVWSKDTECEDYIRSLTSYIFKKLSIHDTCYILQESSVITLLSCSTEIPVFQIVPTDQRSPDSIVRTFDADYVQCFLFRDRVSVTPECFNALRTRCISVTNKNHSIDRCYKAINKGFSYSDVPLAMRNAWEQSRGDIEGLKDILSKDPKVKQKNTRCFRPRTDTEHVNIALLELIFPLSVFIGSDLHTFEQNYRHELRTEEGPYGFAISQTSMKDDEWTLGDPWLNINGRRYMSILDSRTRLPFSFEIDTPFSQGCLYRCTNPNNPYYNIALTLRDCEEFISLLDRIHSQMLSQIKRQKKWLHRGLFGDDPDEARIRCSTMLLYRRESPRRSESAFLHVNFKNPVPVRNLHLNRTEIVDPSTPDDAQVMQWLRSDIQMSLRFTFSRLLVEGMIFPVKSLQEITLRPNRILKRKISSLED
jgi:hypothetical protein